MPRGFAAMDKERLREIASKGGKAAQATGKAHRWNTKEAIVAGVKGGAITSRNREHMVKVGRMGGLARKAS